MSEVGFVLKEKVQALKDAMLEQHPRMPTLLSEIHAALLKQPEQVTLMSEDELQVLLSGLTKQSGVQFAKAATAGKTGSTKSLAAKIASGALDL